MPEWYHRWSYQLDRGGEACGDVDCLAQIEMETPPLNRELFAPHVKTSFRFEKEGGPVDLELEEVAGGRGGPRPFSLTFRGPKESFLPQRTYRVEHPALGSLDIFIVPIGLDPSGYRYEAVFN
jgi:hypothetical protein